MEPLGTPCSHCLGVQGPECYIQLTFPGKVSSVIQAVSAHCATQDQGGFWRSVPLTRVPMRLRQPPWRGGKGGGHPEGAPGSYGTALAFPVHLGDLGPGQLPPFPHPPSRGCGFPMSQRCCEDHQGGKRGISWRSLFQDQDRCGRHAPGARAAMPEQRWALLTAQQGTSASESKSEEP